MTDNRSDAANNPGWNFDNSYTRLPDPFYSRLEPTPVSAPELVVVNDALAAELGLDAELLKTQEGAAILAGNQLPPGADPLAQAYAGHQFGHFTMLGDGRAILLGEQVTPDGERRDIQLKGPGRTPYSRQGDGRAALGPMLREHIISEAMHGLGIPTTRSLAVTLTGDPVYREEVLRGAVLTRVAASHLRVGTFQYAAGLGRKELLQALADYTIERHDAELAGTEDQYLALLRHVVSRQAALIARWQLVGFIHGVMNTDNMALSGETIDYGPCAFMDVFDPATVFSSIDRQGRYAYGNQPKIGVWNLARFAETLLPLLDEDTDAAVRIAEEALGAFSTEFEQHWLSGMRAKLGLFTEEAEDGELVRGLLDLMHAEKADYTNTFRALTLGQPERSPLSCAADFDGWLERWRARRGRQPELETMSEQLMRRTNPAVIPRNHLVEEALAAAETGDYDVMHRLVAALADPFAYTAEQDAYAELPDSSDRPYRTYCGT
ncbi:protein adenylyltransferase SelO [Paenibacillus sp. 1P07SE]|uniref:protein adenylyltransferase SelO n=1 Tax=Paenibacillus sp. 1P07SE TaxID=3132209 RepID=UPI0039A63525